MYDPQIGRWMVQDPLTEFRLNLSPFNYCNNNPILYIDLFGLQDTIKLPEVIIVAYRNNPEPPRFISFLYAIDRALEGNSNPSKIRDADFFEDWCIKHFDMRTVKEIGETVGDESAEGTNNNKVRSNESYQGTEDKEIQEKAGNNTELIDEKSEWARKKDANTDNKKSTKTNADTTITIRTKKQGVFNKYQYLDYKDTVIKVSDIQKVEDLSNKRVKDFQKGF